jgi:hypothetical protein
VSWSSTSILPAIVVLAAIRQMPFVCSPSNCAAQTGAKLPAEPELLGTLTSIKVSATELPIVF